MYANNDTILQLSNVHLQLLDNQLTHLPAHQFFPPCVVLPLHGQFVGVRDFGRSRSAILRESVSLRHMFHWLYGNCPGMWTVVYSLPYICVLEMPNELQYTIVPWSFICNDHGHVLMLQGGGQMQRQAIVGAQGKGRIFPVLR